MCIHVFFLSIQDSEAVPEHTMKKFKPSVDSGAHCSKDLVRIDYFLFILLNVHFELQASSDWNETVQQSSDNTGKVCLSLMTCVLLHVILYQASPREVIDLGSGSESDNESELVRVCIIN